MSVFPGGLLKCAVTLELLATMLAQKEVLATAQTHEAQEGAGVCPSVGKGACTRLRTAPRARAKQTRSACFELRRKTDETAAFQRACFAMSSACMPLHRRVDDSEHEESAMMVAGEFCEVEKHPLPAGGAAAAKRGREFAIAGDWQSGGGRRRGARLLRVVRILQTANRTCCTSVTSVTPVITTTSRY